MDVTSNQFNSNRLDITERVYGKLQNGDMDLYVNKEYIGKVCYTPEGKQYQMLEGYSCEQDRIYRYDSATAQPNQTYVEDCDLGWC